SPTGRASPPTSASTRGRASSGSAASARRSASSAWTTGTEKSEMAGGSGRLARDLVVVTGKGGVGKSTVAAALGLVAARRGLRTIVAEVSARDDVSRALGGEAAEHEQELRPGLHHISVDPQSAMEEYLVDQLP